MRVLYSHKRSIAIFSIVCIIFSIMIVSISAHAFYFNNNTETTQEEYSIPEKTNANIDDVYKQAALVATINPETIQEIKPQDNEEVIDTNNETEDSNEVIEKPSEVIHTVAAGESWWSISNKYYGNGKYYKALAAYNDKNYNKDLYSGDDLTIPDINNSEFQNYYTNESLINGTLNASLIMYSGPKTAYKYGTRTNPAVDITIPSSGSSMKNYTGEVDTSNYESLGTYKITGYTPGCVHCCGNDEGIGAAGVEVICGYSVAAPKNIPLGTTLYIEGYGYYVVEDRGAFGNGVIDIACPSHDACGPITSTGINVYIVPNN